MYYKGTPWLNIIEMYDTGTPWLNIIEKLLQIENMIQNDMS